MRSIDLYVDDGIDDLVRDCSISIADALEILLSCTKPLISKYAEFSIYCILHTHDDVIKWKHFPRNWPFVRGIHRSRWIPCTKASNAELWCFRWSASEKNGWVNNREAGDLWRHRGHYDVIVMRHYCFRTHLPLGGHWWRIQPKRIPHVWEFLHSTLHGPWPMCYCAAKPFHSKGRMENEWLWRTCGLRVWTSVG